MLQSRLLQRQRILPPETNAFRLITEDEIWRGVSVDYLAGRYLVSLRNAELPAELRDCLLRREADSFVKFLDKEQKNAPAPLREPKQELLFHVTENGVRFILDMQSGYSQGLFIDQRDNRTHLRTLCHPGQTVLNLFAYTGAFSVCAALAGATTTTLDLAQPCLNRCKENMLLNGIDPGLHFFCRGDALHWLSRFAKQNRHFHFIIMDPPTFSRDDKGNLWRAEKDYTALVKRASACLAPGGAMLCTTNSRRLSQEAFASLVRTGSPSTARMESCPMPPDFSPENYLKTIWIYT